MSVMQRRLLKTLGILLAVTTVGLGAHFLIRAIVAMHS